MCFQSFCMSRTLCDASTVEVWPSDVPCVPCHAMPCSVRLNPGTTARPQASPTSPPPPNWMGTRPWPRWMGRRGSSWSGRRRRPRRRPSSCWTRSRAGRRSRGRTPGRWWTSSAPPWRRCRPCSRRPVPSVWNAAARPNTGVAGVFSPLL